MSFNVVLLGVAHVHAAGYAHALRQMSDAAFKGVWDENIGRAESFADAHSVPHFDRLEAAIDAADAVIIASENLRHGVLIEAACEAGKPVLCEKPLAASREEAARIEKAFTQSGVLGMTAFPCPFSPTFTRVQARLAAGEIGSLVGISATNRGTCPHGWFTDLELAGGGAMMDHTVHVADLLCRMLGSEPTQVRASISNTMFEGEVDDCAIVMLDFEGGVFATIDASWSRQPTYRTWGDVNFNVVGDQGVIEAALFEQALLQTGERGIRNASYGSNLDILMLQEFIASIREQREPLTTWQDGLRASRIALEAYESLRSAVS